VSGLLRAAERHGLKPSTVDLRNSGDTAGPRDEVVGYGAWVFTPTASEGLSERDRGSLLEVAGQAVHQAVTEGRPVAIDTARYAESLRRPGASFVTVEVAGQLRGCIGALEPYRPLVEDVAFHAYAAVCEDGRFAPIATSELDALMLEIAVLDAPEALHFDSEGELVAQIRPGIDGLILSDGPYRGTFLPKVWSKVPDPGEFISLLKNKAGLPANHWSSRLTVERYTVETFAAPLRQLSVTGYMTGYMS
jgi:hypothetical protein